MIRNVVLMRLPDAADPAADAAAREELGSALDAIRALAMPGLVDVRIGFDLGLRDGGWTAAITSDWADEDAYRAYDLDPEHNVHRARIVAVCEQVARVQFAREG